VCLTVYQPYNKVQDQQDATIKFYWSSKQLNMFRAILWTLSGAQDCDLQGVVYWPHVVGRRSGMRRHGLCVRAATLRTSDRQPADSIPHAVNHSLALLINCKELPETYWAALEINKLLFLHLVGPLIYYNHSFLTVHYSFSIGSVDKIYGSKCVITYVRKISPAKRKCEWREMHLSQDTLFAYAHTTNCDECMSYR